MVYRKQGGHTYYLRVTDADGNRRTCSTGTTLKSVATAVEGWVVSLRGRHDLQGILADIVAKRITLAKAYRLGEAGVVAQRQQAEAEARDIDLLPLLTEWEAVRRTRARGQASTPVYRKQIRVLYPETPWRRSTLTVPEVARRLDSLVVPTDATRNRYRAALSVFCTWLARRGVLPENPARLAGGYSEPLKAVKFCSMADAQRVIDALPAAYRGREAMMVGTGVDWSDTARMRVRDINLETREVRCHGSKTPWRNRVVRITQAWVLPYLKAAMKGKLPDALVFTGAHGPALRQHVKAVGAVGLAGQVGGLHAWRDVYAVAELQAGEYVTVVAHQLGHRDGHLVWKRYGRYVPQSHNYREARAAASATNLATGTAGGGTQ